MSKDFEQKLLFGTLNEARQACLDNPNTTTYDLQTLAKRYGLPEDLAHLLVFTTMQVAKRQVVAEVEKHTATLLYFVKQV